MEEEAEDDALGYLTLPLPAPVWFFDLLVGVTPLLQVGLSDPGGKTQTHIREQGTFLLGLFISLEQD